MAVITIREKQPTENGFAASLIFKGGEYPINIGLGSSYNRYMESKETQERKIGIFFCRLEYENLYNALQICLEKQETVDIFFCLFQFLYLNQDIQNALN